MKNWIFTSSAAVFCLLFSTCDQNQNKPAAAPTAETLASRSAAVLLSDSIIITHAKNGVPSKEPENRALIQIIRKDSLSTETEQTLPFLWQNVQNGDIIRIRRVGFEPLEIRIDEKLHLAQLGVTLFPDKSDNFETIRGNVKNFRGQDVASLHLHVDALHGMTDSQGNFQVQSANAKTFSISYFHPMSGALNAAITATLANDNGGTTIIDVAFDDTGTKKID